MYRTNTVFHLSHLISHFLGLILVLQSGQCDNSCLVPLGIKTPALPPDDRYMIDIINYGSNYVPNQQYTVVLKSKDENTKFIAFTISITGDTVKDPENPRPPRTLQAGKLLPLPEEGLTSFGECPNTVIQRDVTPKTSVQVIWKAPPKGNGCVTIHAMVAIRTDMYYSGLTKHVCEDTRKLDDMPPEGNPNCNVCEDARYKMIFEGLWSYNTHRPLYPTSNASTPSFSDIVGASHNKEYAIFISNMEASEGVKSLAEQGNTTKLEIDMQEKIGNSVRTIIKATRPRTTNANTTAIFRVGKNHHLVSVVTAILPSPDWFLGASNLELCNAKTNNWADYITYNLYPMDAGIDKGTDFNSANDILIPAQPISAVAFQNGPKEQKPFARIHFRLIRTYELTPGCFEQREDGVEESEDNDKTKVEDTNEEGDADDESSDKSSTVTTTSEVPLVTDPESSAECPMTAWSEWDECEGSCAGGKRRGQHKRERYHVVNRMPVLYGDELESQVPENCKEMEENDFEICEEDCEETTTAEPVTQQRLAPGQSWRMWFN